MAAENEPGGRAEDRALVITRVFDAPRELVFEAWTKPERLARWWGPKGFTATPREMELRPGGRWRISMRSPDGIEHWARGVYREISAPDRLEFTWAWEKPVGTPGRETLVTVTFAEQGAKTKLTFRQAEFETVEDRDEHEGGWSESFERLAEYAAKGGTQGNSAERSEGAIMLGEKDASATLAVSDIEKAKKFYGGTLGLTSIESGEPEVLVYTTGSTKLMVYRSQYAGTNKATAATWAVGQDVDAIVEALKARGVVFEKYDLPHTTREGDVHVAGKMRVAWFKDPDGNILSLVNDPGGR